MRSRIWVLALFTVAWTAGGRVTFAQSAGAVSSGNWNDPTIWTTGTVPGSSTRVYIGSTTPSGSAATATVSLTQNQSASVVYLGLGSGTSGTLNLGSNALTISNGLDIGVNGGTGTIQEAPGGSFTAGSVVVDGPNTLAFGAHDQTGSLSLSGGATATTAGQNITSSATIGAGSTLNLGADLAFNPSYGGSLSADGKNATFNMNGHALSAPGLNLVDLGYSSGYATNLLNRGAITAGSLQVGNTTFDLASTDKVTDFYLNNATSTLHSSVSSLDLRDGSVATTTAGGNVTLNVSVASGSALHMGADLKVGNVVDVEGQGSVLDMGGHSITALSVDLGGNSPAGQLITVENQGNIAASELYVGNIKYDLLAGDKLTTFELYNASSTLNGAVANLSLRSDSTASTIAGTPMTMSSISLDRTSTLTLHGGDEVTSSISLTNGSLLTLQETNGTGVTYDGANPTTTSSHIDLNFTATGWDFRWKDTYAPGGNWISTIDGLISSGEMVINLPPGGSYQVVDQGGYTYVKGIGVASVPEPSSLVLLSIAGASLAIGRQWRSRRARR